MTAVPPVGRSTHIEQNMSGEPKEQSNAVSNVHVTECSSGGDPEAMAKMMRSMHGPQAVDQSLRHAVSMCWMMLPDDRKNVESVEREIRRLVDRIIADMHEDVEAFGVSQTGSGGQHGTDHQVY